LLTAVSDITALRPHFRSHNRELLCTLLNARNVAEANLALDVLKDEVAAKTLVKACNMREVLQGVPATPFVMRVDEATLQRANGLDRRMAALSKRLADRSELTITTAGNLVLDLIVRDPEGEPHYWTPIPATSDFVSPAVLDLLVNSPCLLGEVIELVKGMGVVFNPKFYLSLEDFYLEYASDAFDAIEDMF
jgi:hypothetical protein